MLPNIVLKCSGFFLKPISVRTSDWLMSGMEKYSREGRKESARLAQRGQGWCWRPLLARARTGAHTSRLTFLLGHVDGLAVAEGAPASARRVHFVLHTAVNDPELDLRWGRRARSLLCWVFLLRFMFEYGEETQPASFFTAKPTETETKGNLRRGSSNVKLSELPAGTDSIIRLVGLIIRTEKTIKGRT